MAEFVQTGPRTADLGPSAFGPYAWTSIKPAIWREVARRSAEALTFVRASSDGQIRKARFCGKAVESDIFHRNIFATVTSLLS